MLPTTRDERVKRTEARPIAVAMTKHIVFVGQPDYPGFRGGVDHALLWALGP
jgi:hypothetical protein